MRKVVIAGGTGFLGRALSERMLELGYSVTILTRGKSRVINGVKHVNWDAKTKGDWQFELENCEMVVNLVGKSVDCRYTEENKALILSSRVDATTILGQVIGGLIDPPALWINASTATIYTDSYDRPHTEETGVLGNDFSMTVAQNWEDALYNSPAKTRKVSLRISLVLGCDGGVFPVLKKQVRLGLGGYHGNGKQRFAWVHIEDAIGIIEHIKNNPRISGPINCTAPSDATDRSFMKAFRQVLKVPFGLPAPTLMIKIGCFFMQTEPELILKSRYVYPKKIIDSGYAFKFTQLPYALTNLITSSKHGK